MEHGNLHKPRSEKCICKWVLRVFVSRKKEHNFRTGGLTNIDAQDKMY